MRGRQSFNVTEEQPSILLLIEQGFKLKDMCDRVIFPCFSFNIIALLLKNEKF